MNKKKVQKNLKKEQKKSNKVHDKREKYKKEVQGKRIKYVDKEKSTKKLLDLRSLIVNVLIFSCLIE